MKWSGRVKLTVDGLVIRYFAMLAAIGAMRVSVWLRSGLRTRFRLIRRMIACLLLGVMLAFGFSVCVPIARATTSFSGYAAFGYMGSGYTTLCAVATDVNLVWDSGKLVYTGESGGVGWGGVGGTGFDSAFTVDGVLQVNAMTCDAHAWGAFDNVGVRFAAVEGSHTYTWWFHTDDDYGGGPLTYTGSVTYDTAVGGVVFPVVPLSVSISGPSAASSVDGGTWTATGSGGTGPYTYAWAYGPIGPFFSYPYSGSTFTKTLPVGNWTVECQVTDSTGGMATVDQVVTSSVIVGAYTVDLKRSGNSGQNLSAIVHNADGTFIGISDAADTQLGSYGVVDPGTGDPVYVWIDNVGAGGQNGASDGATGYWRWVLAMPAAVGTAPPAGDFWFKTMLTLTDDTVLEVDHHFSGYDDVFTAWYPAGGGPSVAPEVPPVPSVSSIPSWLQALKDALTVLLVPVTFVFDALKMLVNWIVGLLGYIGGAISIVASFGLLMVRWLTVVVASVFNFATAAPGSYVSIQGLMTLAGAGAIAGDTSIFKTVGFSVSSMDAILEAIHTWVMASSHQWIWWAVFSYAFLAFVLQLGGGSSGGDE